MAISFIGSATGTNTATMPAHQAGDLLVVSVVRFGSSASPTVPSGWIDVLGRSGSVGTNHRKVYYRFAASGSEVVGTWTNASLLTVQVYRGVAAVGSFIQAFSSGGATLIYDPINSQNNVTSWIYSMAMAVSTSQPIETPRADSTFRIGNANATGEIASFDTNGSISSFPSQNISLSSSVVWATASIELVAAPRSVTPQAGSYITSGVDTPIFDPAKSPISFVGAASGTNTATMPAHQAGDLIVVVQYNTANTTLPSLVSGFTNFNNSTITPGARRTSYKFAASSGEVLPASITNTSIIEVLVYRGTRQTLPIGKIAATSVATSSVMNWADLNPLNKDDGSSWIVAFGIAFSTATAIESPPVAMTLRDNAIVGSAEVAIFDSAGGAAGFGSRSIDLGASVARAGLAFEILAPVNTNILAEPGSYAISGADTNLVRSYTIAADPGSYMVSGADTAFVRSLLMTAAPGSYSISGADTYIEEGRVILAQPGSYAISGADTPFVRSLIMSGAGSYQVSGADTPILRHLVIAAEAGGYAITGTDTLLQRGYVMSGAGSYSISGANTPFVRSLIMSGAGSYQVSGADTAFLKSYTIFADAGSYAIDGSDTSFEIALNSVHVQVFDGEEWVLGFMRMWDGSEWVRPPLKWWNGSEYIEL